MITILTTELSVIRTVTQEPRRIVFDFDPLTGSISVTGNYEQVTRDTGADGVVTVVNRVGIKQATIPWSDAVAISPSLAEVKQEFDTALPGILATPAEN